ncbi:TPA: Fe-S cluster assembly protein SufB [Candidatus Woesearchaeota archaeon]|nr:Protein SufB [archaeon GW2011_AR15]MBS3104421.1 Fe-S cluster assembly protein SufB [Candidatus Woesearchaeota archaeon]HIH41266.1 Fe-S cluster assembly protein SufB [Candidatus Woesearchaeota archaeon]
MGTDSDLLKGIDEYKFGFKDTSKPVFRSRKGLDELVVRQISEHKHEPQWMLDFRLKALKHFENRPMPAWGADLSGLNLNEIYFYTKPAGKEGKSWDDVPENIKKTFEKLGIPEAEQKFLAGVGAQYESEMVYHNIKESLAKKGVIFKSIEQGLRDHPDLFREYFGKIIPIEDNKFASLNSAVWSGGSFVYIPKNVKVDLPLQAYFRINDPDMGQFERTLIIADEGSEAQYVEGCTAPIYTTDSFHSGVIEIVVKPGARFRYTTIQNWSNNMYNLVTQRAYVYRDAKMEWVDANIGSKVTMKYPSCYLLEEKAHGEILSMGFASGHQHQDTGGKMLHFAPHTTSKITAKSISMKGGRASYRGLLDIKESAYGAKSNVVCDALLMDEESRSDTYPYMEINGDDATVGHEASVSKIGEEQLFYLTSKGLSADEARSMVVSGFIEPLVKELPMEYAIEMNRLIQLQMEGSVG